MVGEGAHKFDRRMYAGEGLASSRSVVRAASAINWFIEVLEGPRCGLTCISRTNAFIFRDEGAINKR